MNNQTDVRRGRLAIRAAVSSICVGLAGMPCDAQQAPAPSVIATQGQQTPDGQYFRSVGAPEISSRGEVVFYAEIADHPSIGQAFGSIWQWYNGTLELVAGPVSLQGTMRTPTRYTGFGGLPRTWADRFVAYSAIVRTVPYDPDRASTVWVWDGTQQKIAQEGDGVPGIEPARYDGGFSLDGVGISGQMVFSTHLRGVGVNSENDEAMLYHADGVTGVLVRKGSPLSPDLPGVNVINEPGPSVTIDAQGQVLFHAMLDGPEVEPWTDQAIVMGTPNALDVVVRRGDPAIGIDGGLVFGNIGYVSMNAHGNVLFAAHLNEPPNGTSRVGEAVWEGPPGGLFPLIRDGEGLAGTAETVYKFSFLQQNDAGDLAFMCRLDPRDRNPVAIAVRSAGSPQVRGLAVGGQAAPGTEPGTVFSESLEPSTPFLTGLGNVAFVWYLDGPEIDDTNNAGLWASDTHGELKLVLRAGDSVNLSDTDTRVVRQILPRQPSFSGSQLNRVVAARGEMCFLVEYTDMTRSVVVIDLAPCLADFDGNGEVDTLDVLGFLNAFVAGDSSADFDGNGNVNTLDVLFFLNEFSQPC